jgi:hypothetical protein
VHHRPNMGCNRRQRRDVARRHHLRQYRLGVRLHSFAQQAIGQLDDAIEDIGVFIE